MAKKDIGKLLTTGSAKQRVLLVREDIARQTLGKERLLSDSEFNQLYDSFKSDKEIDLWNDFRRLDEIVTNAINNLQGAKFEVLMNYSNLRGYILVWNTLETTELLVNSVLHEIKDTKQRKEIAEKIEHRATSLFFTRTETDQEGYIDIQIDYKRNEGEFNLYLLMSNVKKEVENSIIKYLSWEKALLDFMEDKGFNIKSYKDAIKEMSTQIYSPIISWAKYSGELTTGLPHSRLEELIKKYSICPNIGELKVDKVPYNWFKNKMLTDE